MNITKNWQTKEIRDFFAVIKSLQNSQEIAAFFRDVATIREITEMAARWKAAKLLNKKISYREIAEKTGLSSATISRVAFWIKSGTGGYQKALGINQKHHAP